MKKIDIEKLNRKNFRAITSSLSMPGTVKKIKPLFGSSFLSLASILLYNEVSYFSKGVEDMSLVIDITNPKLETKEKADYIFSSSIYKDLLNSCKRGTFISPDYSATLIFGCEEFDKTKVVLSGPGINIQKEAFLPCDYEFISILKEKNSNYPLGVEIFFINKNSEVLALSRTTNIEVIL